MSETHVYCTFRVNGTLYGIDVRSVHEVFRTQESTPVPLAPDTVRGLINLRGQIVTVIDLRRRLGLPARDETPPINVLVRTAHEMVSLLVDEIGDVVEANEDAFETPPDTLHGAAREVIRGAYKLEKELLLVLDTQSSTELEKTG